jgi:hypothetical protein
VYFIFSVQLESCGQCSFALVLQLGMLELVFSASEVQKETHADLLGDCFTARLQPPEELTQILALH